MVDGLLCGWMDVGCPIKSPFHVVWILGVIGMRFDFDWLAGSTENKVGGEGPEEERRTIVAC